MNEPRAPLNDAFAILEPADLEFLEGILGLGSDGDAVDDLDGRRRALLHELRYAGSSDIMYAIRRATGAEPGVSFEEVVRDVAQTLRVPAAGDTPRALVEHVASAHAAATFGKLPREEQQRMLEDLGVEREKAAAFLARSAGIFAVPALIQAFNFFVVEGLIRTVLFGSIARFIGSRLAGQLFAFLAARMPWWVTWVGPAAWTASIGWTAVDLQGPAYRKTVPAVLYLGLCSLRERGADAP